MTDKMWDPWAKADMSSGERHHLAHHCADVVACFERIIETPAISNRLEQSAKRTLTAADRSRLAALVFLHDCGKLTPGFQAKASDRATSTAPGGHLSEAYQIFGSTQAARAADALHVAALDAWSAYELLPAVISHHGQPVPWANAASLFELGPATFGCRPYDPFAAAEVLGSAMRRWFAPAFESVDAPLPSSPTFQHLLCGLTTLADWLGSNRSWFPFSAEFDAEYISTARRRAARILGETAIEASAQRAALTEAPSFFAVTGLATPRPQQALIGETDLAAKTVILEAATGSGKTEASL